jgi:hypothetical protein
MAAVHSAQLAEPETAVDLEPPLPPIDRYDPAPSFAEPRPIPAYERAALEIDFYNRDPWQFDKKDGRFRLGQRFVFNLQANRFEAGGKDTISGFIRYDPKSGHFYNSGWFFLNSDRHKDISLHYDSVRQRFYADLRYNARTKEYSSRKHYDPQSDKINRTSDDPFSFTGERDVEVQVDEGIAAGVRLEPEWVRQIVEIESPVHISEVARRLSHAASLTRISSVIQSAAEAGAAGAAAAGTIVRRGDFLWRPDMGSPPVRSRANLPAVSRSIEYIAPEEIDAAIGLAAGDAIAITAKELANLTGALLGYQRVTGATKEVILDRIDHLQQTGFLLTIGINLRLAAVPVLYSITAS